MSRPVVFATYSNSTVDPLGALNVERENIYTCFLRTMIKQQVVYVAPPFDVKSNDFDGLVEQFTHLTIFHYSGHASSNSLLIEEKRFLSSQLNNLLKGITVDIVILNGCSTKGFVKELLKKKGVKAVIATERKVNDTFATAFATRFYKALLGGKSLLDAFANGQSVDGGYVSSGDYRSLDTGEEDDDQCPFGIYYDKNDPVKVSQVEHFRLIDPLAEAIEPFIDPDIKAKIERLEAKGLKLQQAIDGYSKGFPLALDLIQSLLEGIEQLEGIELPEFNPANPANTMLALYDRIADLVMKQYEPIIQTALLTKFSSFNYRDQRERYVPFVSQNIDQKAVTGAFLLQGGSGAGLMLLQRNIQDTYELPQSKQLIELIEIPLKTKSGPALPPDIVAIWKAVGKKVGLEQGQPDEVVAEFRRRHQFKPVILVFSGVEIPKMTQLIILDFWNEFKARLKPGSSHKLLLFVLATFDVVPAQSPYDQLIPTNQETCITPIVRGVKRKEVGDWQLFAGISYPYDMNFFDAEPPVTDAIREICTNLKGRDPKYWKLYENHLAPYFKD